MFSWASVRAGTIQLRTRILRATVIVLIPVLFVILLEGAFLLLNHVTADHPDQLTPYLFEFSIPLGYKPIPGADERAFLKDGDRFVFDVAYRTDAYGRRRCPEPSQPAANFTAFFGGSFTFGEGLADADTLPAQFAAHTPDMHVYNYGFSGYGPQQVIAKLEEKTLAEEIPQSNGTLVYVFMSAHVRRAIGSMRMWVQWGRHFPHYAYGEDGIVERRGSFYTGRPWRTRLYDLLKREQVLRYFEVDFPPRILPRHEVFTADLIAASRDAFLAQYPDGRFVVLLYPHAPDLEYDAQGMAPLLDEREIETLDLTHLIDLSQSEYRIPIDAHPSALAQEKVAEALAQYLQGSPAK